MTESKWTPGPWKQNERNIIGYPESDIAVARVLGNVGQPWEANAHLIAAAPQMAEALHRLLSEAIQHPSLSQEYDAACRNAEAALAAAEGREE